MKKYRPEIDGLRAVSVILVMFFHGGFESFSGGFVGVDVFFVISGYLITSILLDDIENDDLNIAKFLKDGLGGFFQAYFWFCLYVSSSAWMHMLPNEFQSFSQSLISVPFFISNIYFWRQSGYFEALQSETPLFAM